MKHLNINLKSNENLYVTTYEDGNVEYIPSTPEDHEKEVKRLRNLGVVFATEIRNDLVREFEDKEIDFTLGFTEQEQIEIERKHNKK